MLNHQAPQESDDVSIFGLNLWSYVDTGHSIILATPSMKPRTFYYSSGGRGWVQNFVFLVSCSHLYPAKRLFRRIRRVHDRIRSTILVEERPAICGNNAMRPPGPSPDRL
jgi:hypothetical protein